MSTTVICPTVHAANLLTLMLTQEGASAMWYRRSEDGKPTVLTTANGRLISSCIDSVAGMVR